ncbi:unnamed protein product [Effrenium voratum]|nr:unnamed protein product [Effrenium voratum]
MTRLALLVLTVVRAEVATVFSSETAAVVGRDKLAHGLDATLEDWEQRFDWKAHDHLLRHLNTSLSRAEASNLYSAYTLAPNAPHCDTRSMMAPAEQVTGVAAFPGGASRQSDCERSLASKTKCCRGAADAILPTVLIKQAVAMGLGMVQVIIAAVVHFVPPMIPPPIWILMPLFCMPMVTGHNCFGAVLYPIPMVDFIMADVTDSMMDGIISGFPNTYASKVGKTSDAAYKACFSSFMSMHCSSIFPRCTTPFSRAEFMPVGGRVPMCFPLCILPLVLCPGFWLDDVIGVCTMVSVPPLCTVAFFWNVWRAAPQYQTFDDANPFPRDCPPADFSQSGLDSPEDPQMFDAVPLAESQSAVEEEAELLAAPAAIAGGLRTRRLGKNARASRQGLARSAESALLPGSDSRKGQDVAQEGETREAEAFCVAAVALLLHRVGSIQTGFARGDVLDDVGAVLANSKITMAPDVPDDLHDVLRGLKLVPGPRKRAKPARKEQQCDADMSVLCPQGFVFLPDDAACLPAVDYLGPCPQRVYFRNMSTPAKLRWSKMCAARWPCQTCDRDYSSHQCPHGFRPTSKARWECQPGPEYTGPCAAAARFDGFNQWMLAKWQDRCQAYWPCQEHSPADLTAEVKRILSPLSLAATLRRLSQL